MKGPLGRERHTGALHHDMWNWVKINYTPLKGDSELEGEGVRRAGLPGKQDTSGKLGENRREEARRHLSAVLFSEPCGQTSIETWPLLLP